MREQHGGRCSGIFSLAARKVTIATLTLVTCGMVSFGSAAPASAYTILEPVMPVAVCNHQGHFGASTWNPFSAYALYCYDFGVSVGAPRGVGLGTTSAGDLDIQGYCSAKWPGSKAIVVDGSSMFGWRCERQA